MDRTAVAHAANGGNVHHVQAARRVSGPHLGGRKLTFSTVPQEIGFEPSSEHGPWTFAIDL